jgi:hypothetical protein
MIAVIGIMLVLMVATFGVFNVMAQQTGPDAAVSTVQAMLNGARDYAATNGVFARVRFTADPKKMTDGTTMTLQYRRTSSESWTDVPRRKPVTLGNQTFVCVQLPALSSPPSKVLDASLAVDPAKQEEADTALKAWKDYEKGVGDKVTAYALTSGTLNSDHRDFGLAFDPTGYLAEEQCSISGSTNQKIYGLTMVQIGGARVAAYTFYPINANTGTSIVFEF